MKDAVALAYLGGNHAPRVVAKGHGLIAEQIIERAREHGIFVHESKELLNLLMQVDLDREIPAALYRAVAELLAWLYLLESEQQSLSESGHLPARVVAALPSSMTGVVTGAVTDTAMTARTHP